MLCLRFPFNGDTKNYGLINGNFTVTNATFCTGKIGKCLNKGSISMDAKTTAKIFNNNAISMAFWIYVNADTGSTTNRTKIFGNNNDRKFSLFQYPTCNDLHLSWQNDEKDAPFVVQILTGVLPSYQWTHVVVTYKNPNGYIYINGKLVKTFSGTSDSSSFEYTTQIIHDSPYHYFNDYRIYNHCLSPLEVSLLSQSMVCHITMDNVDGKIGGRNLLKNTNKGSSGWVMNRKNGSYTITSKTMLGVNGAVINIQEVSTGWSLIQFAYSNILFASMKPGTYYTISFDVLSSYELSGTTLSINDPSGLDAVTSRNTVGTIPANTWTKVCVTVKTVNAFPTISDQVIYWASQNKVGTIQICNLKLEEGSITTPWTPAPEDNSSLYDNTIYDTSGYCNNGTITDSTCPSWSSDSPRYQGCYKFDTTKYIKIDLQDTSGFSNSYSFSWWGNVRAINNKMFWGFGDGNRLNLYCGWLCNTGDGTSNPFYTPGTTTNVSIPSVNVWHHYVMTGDGTTVKYYLDGALYGIAKTYKPITGKTIYINGWNTATEFKIDGCISDFRVYATTLSADDVKELYDSVTSISNTGVLATHEFVEEEI